MVLFASSISKLRRNHKKPQLVIIYGSIDQLQLSSDNPRIHSDKQIRQIARSVEEFGFIVPILVDHQLRVVAGHGRCQAGQLLGLKSCWPDNSRLFQKLTSTSAWM